MKNEYNTDEHSLNRIYKKVTFSSVSLDRPTGTSKEQTILDFITRARKIAKENNIVGYDIMPDYDEGDCDNLPDFELCAEGYRLETDEEYKNRLKWNLSHLKTGYENWRSKQSYYNDNTPNGYQSKYDQLLDIIGQIENKEDCH